MRRQGHEWFDQGPFGVGEGACVAQSGPAISLPGDISPGHRVSARLRKRTETQPAEIAQFIFCGPALIGTQLSGIIRERISSDFSQAGCAT